MLTGDDYFSGHLVSSHFGLAYVLLVEINDYPELVVFFTGLFISNIPRYFLDFALSGRLNDIVQLDLLSICYDSSRFKGTRDILKIHVNFMKPTFLCRLRQDEAYDKK